MTTNTEQYRKEVVAPRMTDAPPFPQGAETEFLALVEAQVGEGNAFNSLCRALAAADAGLRVLVLTDAGPAFAFAKAMLADHFNRLRDRFDPAFGCNNGFLTKHDLGSCVLVACPESSLAGYRFDLLIDLASKEPTA